MTYQSTCIYHYYYSSHYSIMMYYHPLKCENGYSWWKSWIKSSDSSVVFLLEWRVNKIHLILDRNSDVETYLSSPKSPAENSTGHQFLQPRVNSGTAGRRNLSGNASANSPNPSIDPPSQMFMYQPVLNVDSSNLPVHQRIMEGLPVVTLPGLVAHEVFTLSHQFHWNQL